MSIFFTVLSVASSAMQAISAYNQGMAMKAYYDAQADVSALKYKTQRVEAREQGVKALKESNKALSSIIARGAAGGILTNEGSMLFQQSLSIREGAEDFQISKINQELLQNLGIIEFTNLKQAGQQSKQTGIMGALTGFGTDMVGLNKVAGGGGGLFDNLQNPFTPAKTSYLTGYNAKKESAINLGLLSGR
jgi:hypothetical protein